jgi:hypothetical protein
MLVIRDAQLQALARDRLANFKRRLRKHLQDAVPSHPSVEDLVERGVPVASRYGFSTERHTAQFLAISARRLTGFPDAGIPVPALAILMAHGADPEWKLRRYEEWANSTNSAKAGAAHG